MPAGPPPTTQQVVEISLNVSPPSEVYIYDVAPGLIFEMTERPAAGADVMPGLVERARAGGETAFEQLMRMHERQVLLTSLRLLGRLEDAQDAAQEVFLRLYRNLKIFDATAEIRPWLYRVTVNVCRDQLRRRGGAAVEMTEMASVESLPDEQVDIDERRALLAEALQRLPERERAAIVLRDIEGLETDEVAGILGSTPATVRSQISTGRERLRGIVARLMRRKV